MIPSEQLDSSAAIKLARESLQRNGKFLLGNSKIEVEFYNLDLFTREERLMAIDIALQEISPACRLGPQPPGNMSGVKHVYAFCWASPEFKKDMYFKFALSTAAGRTHLYVYSLHESTGKEVEEQ
jgi:hypothetical protein